jgi:hypothetical protein
MQISTTAPLAAPAAPFSGFAPALDDIEAGLAGGRIASALEELFDDLSLRRDEDPDGWPTYASSCLAHPVRRLLHQDPFTYRAFSKPRGYAGDAVMMDYIYGLGEARLAAAAATPLGRAIFNHMSTRPSARAVRFRRQLIAALIDRSAARGGRRVLAFAAGHLREAELSAAIRAGGVDHYLAMDQDADSLRLIARDYAHRGVQTVSGSVRQLLTGKLRPGTFDFVYAAGLYDYLSAPVAAAFTRTLFDLTTPGGMLLVPNFLTGGRDTGYMEAFMDWRLIYRDHRDMEALIHELPARDVASYEIFDDPDDTITFLLVSKRGTAGRG